MKRFYSIAVMLCAVLTVSAQSAELKKWAESSSGKSKQSSVVVVNHNDLNQAGIYLEKSANMQYNALVCTGIGAGLSILGSSTSKYDKSGKSQKSERNSYFIAGGTFGLAAIVCSILSVSYKQKAGRSLRAFSGSGGTGLAYSF